MFGLWRATWGVGSSTMLAWLWLLRGCIPFQEPLPQEAPPATALAPFDAAFVRLSATEVASLPLASVFEAPMGARNGALTYNARPFRTSRHLGDDLNGIGGGNSDLGDPVYAAGDGRVIYTGIPGEGWGQMIMLAHRVPDPTSPLGWRTCVTLYAHLDLIQTKAGALIQRGEKIATVGTANGIYLAHLHFEIRESRSAYPGLGYADSPMDRVPPEKFLYEHRAETSR